MEEKKSIGQELIAGFAELASALESGDDLGNKFTCYRMELDLRPHTYTPKMVRETRGLLGASQRVFARFLGVSVKTVSEWEQGVATPKPIACRFMDEIRRHPKHYVKRLTESAKLKNRRKRV
jgi:Predicted transcriptional regulator